MRRQHSLLSNDAKRRVSLPFLHAKKWLNSFGYPQNRGGRYGGYTINDSTIPPDTPQTERATTRRVRYLTPAFHSPDTLEQRGPLPLLPWEQTSWTSRCCPRNRSRSHSSSIASENRWWKSLLNRCPVEIHAEASVPSKRTELDISPPLPLRLNVTGNILLPPPKPILQETLA